MAGGRQNIEGATGGAKKVSPTSSKPAPGAGVTRPNTVPLTFDIPPVTAIAPAASRQPSASAPRGGGGGGYSSGGGLAPNAMGYIQETPAPATPQNFDQWKAGGGNIGDSAWQAENASAQAEYESLLASLAQQNTSFLNDWRSGMRSMGWKPGEGNDFDQGGWDPTDVLGAYGQSYQNMQNDFAGRGLFDSTFYQQAQTAMDDRFNRQRGEMVSQRDATNSAYQTDQANAMRTRNSAQDRALAEAYARYASGYGV